MNKLVVYAKCPTCGIEGLRVRKLKAWALKNNLEVEVNKVTGYGNEQNKEDWLDILNKNNLDQVAIVVSGNDVKRLDEWTF